MVVWYCDCGVCACGICTGINSDGEACECECHMLEALSNTQLQQLLVDHGEKYIADVVNKNRNQLFKMMATGGHGDTMLQEGVKLVQKSMDEARETPLSFLKQVADQVVRARTPSPKTTKSTTSKSGVRKGEARKTNESNKSKKAAARKKAARKKAARRLDDDCDT